MKPTCVHFGAGNIGRGFIGLLLSRSGYKVTFVVRNEKKEYLLQKKKQYTVTFANKTRETAIVKNVTAINGERYQQRVIRAIAEADLVTTAVGLSSLKHIAETLAGGIELRLRKSLLPLHVIACENSIEGSTQLKKWVYHFLPEKMHYRADRYVAFPNTMVDRIVPVRHHKDPLRVTVEPFYEWIIDRSALINGFKEIKGAEYVESIEPYVERQLFTVNTGHCIAAYHGYLEGYQTIQEVMKDSRLEAEIWKVLNETGKILAQKHHLDEKKHQRYMYSIINRFKNPYLTDRVTRVGRSPIRKLSSSDRLVRPALEAYKLGINTPHLIKAIAAALMFDYAEDPDAVQLQQAIQTLGIKEVIHQYLGIPATHQLHHQIMNQYRLLQQKYVMNKDKRLRHP